MVVSNAFFRAQFLKMSNLIDQLDKEEEPLDPKHPKAIIMRHKVEIGIISAFFLVEIILGIWAEASDDLLAIGLLPRTAKGLLGIIFAPFLSLGFTGALLNAVSILVMGGVMLYVRGIKESLYVTAWIWIMSGLFTWIFGRSNIVMVGAGGIVVGWAIYSIIVPFLDSFEIKKFAISGIVGGFLLVGMFSLLTTDDCMPTLL